jgi:predicted nucleic acid-binding protein
MTEYPVPDLPAVVLDTNAVLDWLLFQDRRMPALREALDGGQLRWLATCRMRDEFCVALSGAALARWQPDEAALLARFDQRVCLWPDPPPAPRNLRCGDPDDQVFVDLALACGARWLVSHDRAVLRLRRPMRAHGTQVCRPGEWTGP